MHRFLTVEDFPQMKADSTLKTHTIELYRLILVFQAEMLRHLTRHAIAKLWTDTFNPAYWGDSLKKIKQQEEECSEVISNESLKYLIANARAIDALQDQVLQSFVEQLEVLQVSDEPLIRRETHDLNER
jgi:hypothetical protein